MTRLHQFAPGHRGRLGVTVLSAVTRFFAITGLFAITGFFAVSGVALAQPRPTVTLTPNPIGLREAALLEIQVEGMSTNLHFDASFKLDNLERVSGPHQSTSLEIVNSVRTSRRTLSWRVRPMRVGEGRVDQINVAMGDQTVSLEPVTVQIQEETPDDRSNRPSRGRRGDRFGQLDSDTFDRFFNRRQRQRQPREAPQVFLRAEATPARPWVGEQVLYTLYLYTQADILSFSHQELPEFKGFWAHEIPHPDQRQPEMVEHEGGRFGRVVLLQRALFPRRGGRYEIEPVRVEMAARVPDNFFDGLLTRTTELERVSNRLTLDVRSLPEAPPGFAGAVGRLSLQGELVPADLAVGDAATLTLTLSGPGQLKGVPQPTLPDLPGIKVFPPQQQASDRLRGSTLVGRRVWSFVLVPERPGTWELPSIGVPYFDPRAGAFRTASVDDLQLEARGATSLPQASGDTVSLHPTRTAALPSARSSLAWSTLQPWLFGTPLALAGLLLLWRRRSGGGHQPARRALLAALDPVHGEDDPRRVAARIEEAWRVFLEARWQVPLGTPSPRWRDRLMSAGVAESDAQRLVELADDLHYLRYAPKLSSTDDLKRELIERSKKLAKTLG